MTRKDGLLALLVVVVWGLNFVVIKLGLHNMPPLMLALLNEPQGLSLAPEHFHVEFHESGRAACFWIDVHSDADIERLSPQARMDALVTRTLQPVVEALAATGEINSKLIWSNTG
ncbi:MAG: siderophore-iron reductase FhuF, partial [Enterobacter hormaechei]|nr:siderophore-iron reductase FhuF [Enterobacter hormaechei]